MLVVVGLGDHHVTRCGGVAKNTHLSVYLDHLRLNLLDNMTNVDAWNDHAAECVSKAQKLDIMTFSLDYLNCFVFTD